MPNSSQWTTSPPVQLSQRSQWSRQQAIGYLMQQAVENPDVLSLAPGLTDPQTLPVEATQTAVQDLLADDQRARQILQYGTTAGAEYARRQLWEHVARLEHCDPGELGIEADQFLLTTGSQQFLALVGEALFDPGDICLVAAPTYFVFLGTLNGLGVRTIPVESDENGMRPEALEATLSRIEAEGELDRLKLIYVVSYYDNPAGVSVAEDRRRSIVELARRWSKRQRLFVLEDAAYRELRYDGPELPSLWSFDPDRETVILVQTCSKCFSPGLRVGYGILPKELIAPVTNQKGNVDFGSAHFNQHLIAAVMERGLYRQHLETVRTNYRQKRDRLLLAAESHFGDISGLDWLHPHGGLYLWMRLPEGVETGFDSRLFQQAVKQEKVMYVPGELFFAGTANQRPKNCLRLSFGVPSIDGLEEGMRRLSRAVRAVL